MHNQYEKEYREKKYGKIIITALAVICLLLPFKGEAKVKAPKMQCHAYAVMDAGSGEVLFGQEENKVIYPASTAKLMTAIVCVENGDTHAKIKTKSKIVDGTTYGTYSLGLASGVKFTFNDLLHMSLLSSAADATDTLAAAVFGSKKACADAMTAKAVEMGLTQTSFDNPVGSDIGAGFDRTYSTAAEMAKVCRYAMSIPMIRSAVAKAHYQVTSGQDLQVNTTNWFLRGMAYYDRDNYKIIGSKSGTTNAAGNVFIATAVDEEGHEVICAYFGNVSKESTFTSIRKLLDYTFEKAKKGKIELTPSNYDVRCSKELGQVYDTYANLHCYPSSADGLFHPGKGMTRKEMAALVKGVNHPAADKALDAFAAGNPTGKVTAGKLALLIQKLYPDHLSEKEIEEQLKNCTHTEEMTAEEREAFALFQKNQLGADDFCKNARQIITRKQALFIVDRLADYQMKYYASHPMLPGGDFAKTSATAQETGSGPWPQETMLSGLNQKWMNHLTQQAQIRAAQEAAKAAAEAQLAKEAEAAAETTAAQPEKAAQADTVKKKK